MPNQVSNVSFTDYGLEQEKLARSRKLAEALQGQAMQPDQQQTAGGWVVPYSPMQGLAKMGQAYASALQNKRADERQQSLGQKYQQDTSADVQRLVSAMGGSKAQTIQPDPQEAQQSADYGTPQVGPVNIPAQTPTQSLQGALPEMRTPMGQQLASSYLMEQMKPKELFEKVNPKDYTPESIAAYQQSRNPASLVPVRPLHFANTGGATQGLDPITGQPASQPIAHTQTPDSQANLAFKATAENQDRSPYFSFLQTPNGYMAGNARTGQVSPVTHQGQPVMPAQIDPATQRGVAAAKAGGHEAGGAQAQGAIDLPRVVNNANNSLQLIDQLVGSEDGKSQPHPGFATSVGMGVGRVSKHIPGSQAANFHTLLDQVKGGAFLEAFNSLKGGGQITEIEGKKATDAITRMSTAQSEAEFIKAAREYQGIIRLGVQRAQGKAAGGSPTPGGWSITPVRPGG